MVREHNYDALGRLTSAKGGAGGALWTQNYAYDRFGNRTSVSAAGVAANGSAIPADGFTGLSYNALNNRITNPGAEYDLAGNLTKTVDAYGTAIRLEYDSANRLSVVKRDSDGAYLQAYQYSPSNGRLMNQDYISGEFILYANIGGTTLAEYREYTSQVPTWTKSYVYLGSRLLSTTTPNGQGGEFVEYNHPDRLGTRLITNQATGTVYEQAHLPFGTPLDAESTITTNPKRFTSYDRSTRTGLDYAVNRHYDSKQGRFTRVDPIGMGAANLGNPQSLNMYAYVQNNPVDFVDPSGLLMAIMRCEPDRYRINEKGELVIYAGQCRVEIIGGGGTGIGTNITPRGPGDPGDAGVGSTPQETHCEAFARIVDNYARAAESDSSFINTIYDEFKQISDSRFRSGGFKERFIDNGKSPNQVRHASGAITAGYYGGFAYHYGKDITTIAGGIAGIAARLTGLDREAALKTTLNLFNSREGAFGPKEELGKGPRRIDYSQSDNADINLNGVAVPIGFMLGNGEITRNQVGNLIRRNICN